MTSMQNFVSSNRPQLRRSGFIFRTGASKDAADILMHQNPNSPSICRLPIFLRLVNYRQFKRGPFHLGRWSLPISAIASLWICFITVVFMLPQVNPVTSQTLNYAPVATGAVLLYAVVTWLLSARKCTLPFTLSRGICGSEEFL